MIDNRFNKVLTIIFIIIAVGVIISGSFFAYDLFQKHKIQSGAEKFNNEFENELSTLNIASENTVNVNDIQENATNNSNDNSSGNKISLKYQGFDVAGRIEIPATNLSYPVLTVATNSSMEVSVGIVYGPGLNVKGNTVIMGHNYRNGTLFSNNAKLKNGDEIYITDLNGNRVKYVIYNKYTTSSTDFDYATRPTDGRTEITLESCTDDSESRIIIWAKAE